MWRGRWVYDIYFSCCRVLLGWLIIFQETYGCVFCRYKGFHEYAKSEGLDVGSLVGLDVMIDGTVPTGNSYNSVQCSF